MREIPQGYQKTKVGIIPDDWDLYRIDNILQRVRKKVEVEQEINYQQIGIRSHAKGIFHKELVTGKEIGNKSVFWIEEDCFIVNIVFAWEQAISKTTENERGMIASHRFPMYQPKDNKVDIDYILCFFKSKRGKHLLGLASPGGAGRNKTLGQGEFAELKIPLPSLMEQEKIVKILTTWDNAISKQGELIKIKEGLKKGLIQKLLSSEIRFNGFCDEWQDTMLEKLVFFQEGPGVRNTQYRKIGVKLLNVGNLNNNQLNLDATDKYISEEEAYGNYKHFLVDDGDLLISCSGVNSESFKRKIAFANKNDLPLCMNTSTMRFKSIDNKLDLVYLYHFFQTFNFEKQVFRILTGSAQFNFGPTHIKWFKIYLPSQQEQQRISDVLSNIDKEICLLKNELEELKEQKKGLMQKLLTGEVRVKI